MAIPTSERNRLLAKIHVAKKQADMDDDQYRDFLEEVTNLRSAGDMSPQQLMQVIEAFRRVGAAQTTVSYSPKAGSRKTRKDKVVAMWINLADQGIVRDRSHAALCRFIQNRMGKNLKLMPGVDALQAASQEQLAVVITALEAMENAGASDRSN
jgi:phage gp16-like protein